MWDRPFAVAVRRFAAAGLHGALLLAAQSIGAEPLAAQRRPDTTGAVAIRQAATVEPDCAPWDGAALAFWIPTERLGGPRNGWLSLRLWLPPTRAAGRYDFPDTTDRIGRVVHFVGLTSPKAIDWATQPHEELRGVVQVDRVDTNHPVRLDLDFTAVTGTRLTGRIEAQWIGAGGVCL
ncbi:MAG: hypothetical protein ACK5ZR_13045 [Gemmatimonadaceae bacterium]